MATFRIAATYAVFAETIDEPGHMACGMELLAKHVYRFESQHPPLARVFGALGPFFAGVRPVGLPNQNSEGAAEIRSNGNADRNLTLMRIGILPFFWLACFVVFVWARDTLGDAAAAISVGIFTLIPTVLAHAGLATTDMALTACLSAAFLALIRWAERPDRRRSVTLGIATGLAVLSKFTTLGFFPLATIAALVWWYLRVRPSVLELFKIIRLRAASFALAVAIGAITIWAGYLFSFGPVPGWDVSLPAPELFDGIRSAFAHNSEGHNAYLLGEHSNTGWWYFFPVALAVKTPIALLVLALIGIYACLRDARPAYIPLAFSGAILFAGMTSHVNIGLRHILPIYVGISIIAAAAILYLLRGPAWKPVIAAACVLWLAATGVIHHPDYLAYFNEFVGSEPENVMVDSDLDWGQDVKRLAARLRELGVRDVNFIYYGPGDLHQWPGMPPMRAVVPLFPTRGWTVVSPTVWKADAFGTGNRNARFWPDVKPPTERVGSLLLYYAQ